MALTGADTIKDEPVENLRPMKVRVIGAGYSGIYAAIRCAATRLYSVLLFEDLHRLIYLCL